MKSYKEALAYAHSIRESVYVMESDSDWPHGKFHVIHHGNHNLAHYQGQGYRLLASITMTPVLVEYPKAQPELMPVPSQ